jgi:hypothetical protein
VIINMAFEMGTSGLLHSQAPFIAAIQRGYYDQAVVALRASEWYAKVPKRPAAS